MLIYLFIGLNYDPSSARVCHRTGRDTPHDAVLEGGQHGVLWQVLQDESLGCLAGLFQDYDVLGDIDKATGEVAAVGRPERRIRQTVSLDLEMATDIRKAAASDHIDDALDYKSIGKRVIQFIEDSDFQLVETLAERVADVVREEFGVAWLKLRLSKPGALRGSRDVGVIIERGERT